MLTNKRVTAFYADQNDALHAIQNLERHGVARDQVSMLVTENAWQTKDIKLEENTKAAEGTAIGAAVGATAGAIAAGLTAVGTITATGGLGLLAAGPIVSALAGAGAGGTAGGLLGGLVGLGMPEIEAKYVDEKLGHGHIMVGVETVDKDVDETKRALEEFKPLKVTVH